MRLSVSVFLFMLCLVVPDKMQLAKKAIGQDLSIEAQARLAAAEIMDAFQLGTGIRDCTSSPVHLFVEGEQAGALLIQSTRRGLSPIHIELAEPIVIGALPAFLADALNRVQESGGRVVLHEINEEESVSLIAAWVASMWEEQLVRTIGQLISGTTAAWASAGLRRYTAIVQYHVDSNGVRIVRDVQLVCDD